jgi:hypothetical protein
VNERPPTVIFILRVIVSSSKLPTAIVWFSRAFLSHEAQLVATESAHNISKTKFFIVFF